MKDHEKQFMEFLTEYRKDGFQHENYLDVTEAIKKGDYQTIEEIDWEVYTTVGIGKLSDDPITQARYLVVVVCTMSWIIAIDEGVESEIALSLSDYYIQLSQRLNRVKDLTQLIKNILVHYCKIIKRQKSIPYSRNVRKAIEYIYNNIYTTIYVSDIAAYLEMSPSFLSRTFREETGVHLKDYIHMEKMTEAKNLIRYTNMSCTEIAARLGYSDQSHFTNICKKYEQCTPKQLKEKLYQINCESE